MTADEDDRDVVTRPDEAFLELEPARPRQAQVEHHAGWTVRHRLAQEILGRCVGLDVEVHRPQEPLEGATHRIVVVDHEDDRLVGGLALRHRKAGSRRLRLGGWFGLVNRNQQLTSYINLAAPIST